MTRTLPRCARAFPTSTPRKRVTKDAMQLRCTLASATKPPAAHSRVHWCVAAQPSPRGGFRVNTTRHELLRSLLRFPKSLCVVSLATAAIASAQAPSPIPINDINLGEGQAYRAAISPDGQFVAYAFSDGQTPSTHTVRVRRADGSAPSRLAAQFTNPVTGLSRNHVFTWRQVGNQSRLLFVERAFSATRIWECDPNSPTPPPPNPLPSSLVVSNTQASDALLSRNPVGNDFLVTWENPYADPTQLELEVIRPGASPLRTPLFMSTTGFVLPVDIDPSRSFGLFAQVPFGATPTEQIWRIGLGSPMLHQVTTTSPLRRGLEAGFLGNPNEWFYSYTQTNFVPQVFALEREVAFSSLAQITNNAFDNCPQAYRQPAELLSPAPAASFLAVSHSNTASGTEPREIRLAPPSKGGQVRVGVAGAGNSVFAPTMDGAETRVCWIEVLGGGVSRVWTDTINRELIVGVATTSTTATATIDARPLPSEVAIILVADGLAAPISQPPIAGTLELNSTRTTLSVGASTTSVTLPFNPTFIGVELFFQAVRLTSPTTGNITRPAIARFW